MSLVSQTSSQGAARGGSEGAGAGHLQEIQEESELSGLLVNNTSWLRNCTLAHSFHSRYSAPGSKKGVRTRLRVNKSYSELRFFKFLSEPYLGQFHVPSILTIFVPNK